MAALMETSGHWVWDHDVGFHEYIHGEVGLMSSMAATVRDAVGHVPEQQVFHRMDDGRISMRVINKFSSKEGDVTCLDPSGTPHQGEHDVPVHGKVTGVMRTLFEGNELNTYVSGTRPVSHSAEEKLEIAILRQVIGDEYHMTLDNISKGRKCSRIFKRYPHYKIVNETGHTVTLCTYSKNDMVRMVSAMRQDIPIGTYYVDASDGVTTEEQAVFSLPDGRKYSGFNIHAFSTYVLRDELFQQ